MTTATKSIRVSTAVAAALLTAIAHERKFGVLAISDHQLQAIKCQSKDAGDNVLVVNEDYLCDYKDTPFYAIEQAQAELDGKLVIDKLHNIQHDYTIPMPNNILLMQDEEQVSRLKNEIKNHLTASLNINSVEDAKRYSKQVQSQQVLPIGSTEIELRLGDFYLCCFEADGQLKSVVEYPWVSKVVLQLPFVSYTEENKFDAYLKFILDGRNSNAQSYVEMRIDLIKLVAAVRS